MSTLRSLPKQVPYCPQKQKLAHVVRRAARCNRYWPEFPMSSLSLRRTLCLTPSGVKPAVPWLWLGATSFIAALAGIFKANFPFVKRRRISGGQWHWSEGARGSDPFGWRTTRSLVLS